MYLCSLASGSSGNCIFAASGDTSVLIDAGLSGKKTEAGLNELGYTGTDLDGILVTHEHIDHIKGLGVLARKLGIPIYATHGTIKKIKQDGRMGKVPDELFYEVEADEQLEIGDLTVEPFTISHDAAEPVGYRIECGGSACAVATDMGTYDSYVIGHLQNLDAVLIEANHDTNMLFTGPYPYPLKVRIASDTGHLSNEMTGRLLDRIMNDRMKGIMLGHLSAENNYPALAYETVCDEISEGDCPYNGKELPIEVAPRDRVGVPVEF